MKELVQEKSIVDSLDAKFEVRKALVCEAIDKYHNYLLSYAWSLTHQKQDAEDILSKLWEYALLHLPENKISQIGILRRKCYQIFVDWYRSRVRKAEVLTGDLPEGLTMILRPEPESEAEEAELEANFWSEYPGIEITDVQKSVLWKYARYGYTITEISGMMEVPKSTIGDWLKVAKQKLKEYLET